MEFLQAIWLFIQNEILGMKWLDRIVAAMLHGFGMDADAWYTASLRFFIYDAIKILLLLSILIFTISYIQSYFPPERTRKILGRFKGIGANILAALLGTITPFCSCSSIPLFIGFTSAGLPLGVTFSFLISSPLVDLGSLVLLTSIFGFKIAIAYVVVGLILAVIGGTIIEKAKMEKYVEQFVMNTQVTQIESQEITTVQRLTYAWQQVVATVKKVFLYVLVGVLIGALIHNVIPEEWIRKVLGSGNPLSVVLATFVGIPMYADIFGTIPIAEALHAKGVGIGTILSFMMGVTALSLPSIIMLKKAVKWKLLAVFIAIVTVGIIVIGYVFNLFEAYLI